MSRHTRALGRAPLFFNVPAQGALFGGLQWSF